MNQSGIIFKNESNGFAYLTFLMTVSIPAIVLSFIDPGKPFEADRIFLVWSTVTSKTTVGNPAFPVYQLPSANGARAH